MAEFGEWARLLTQERGVVSLRVNHRSGCPAREGPTIAQLEALAENLRRGMSYEDATNGSGAALCTCETVEVEIS